MQVQRVGEGKFRNGGYFTLYQLWDQHEELLKAIKNSTTSCLLIKLEQLIYKASKEPFGYTGFWYKKLFYKVQTYRGLPKISIKEYNTKQAITCSKLKMKTFDQSAVYVQS